MNSQLESKSLKVFSNLEGQTIMTVKPKQYNLTDRGKKSHSKTSRNFNMKNGKELTDDGKADFFKTISTSKITLDSKINTLPTLDFNPIKTSRNTFRNKISTMSTSPSKDENQNLLKLLKEKENQILSLQEKLKIKDIAIKNLEKKLKSASSLNTIDFQAEVPLQTDPTVSSLKDLQSLLLDFNTYLEQDINQSYTPEESSLIKKKLLRTIACINDNIKTIKSNQETVIRKNRTTIQELKQEIESLKQKDTINTNQIEKYKSDLLIIEKEKNELKNVKKVERVKKVIEATSETLLAKENADLQRRLEIASKFLIKKKEKIEKMNEKINALNKKMIDMIKSQTFTEHEEEKIIEKLSKKLKNENHPIYPHSSKSANKVFSVDHEMNNLEFRVKKLKEKYKELMKDILEKGTNEFIKHFFTTDKIEQERLVEFVCDQMLSHMDFSKRLNQLSNFFIDSLNFTKEELILYIRLKFAEILESERVTLWVYDSRLNEFYTLVNFQKCTESRSNGYFQKVLEVGVYNIYKGLKDTDNEVIDIYAANLEKNFSLKPNVKSILSIGIVDSTKNQTYGILEAVNSHNFIFGYDEEHLMYMLSNFIKWFLIKFSIEEADIKHKTKDSLYSSIIKIMLQKTLSSLCKVFQNEILHLIDAKESRVILINTKGENSADNHYFYYYTQNSEDKQGFPVVGIAGLTVRSQTGIYSKNPNEDEDYNPLVDIESSDSNSCFYSIPIKRDGVGIFAIFQFITERDESSEINYKTTASHHLSKLDFYREKIIDIMSQTFQNAIINIDPYYFKVNF